MFSPKKKNECFFFLIFFYKFNSLGGDLVLEFYLLIVKYFVIARRIISIILDGFFFVLNLFQHKILKNILHCLVLHLKFNVIGWWWIHFKTHKIGRSWFCKSKMGSDGLSNQEMVIGRSWFCQLCHGGNGFVIITSPNLRERERDSQVLILS